MDPAARHQQPERGGGDASQTLRDGELASLYAGVGETDAPYPLLVSPWEEPWDADSELDPQILAGLLRLAP
jgi:hypothetical protein